MSRRGKRNPPTPACPCGTGVEYPRCCGRLHSGEAVAGTPQELMRSRFSAFAKGDAEYLLATWHPDTRPESLDLDATRWTRLEILETRGGTERHNAGTVRFVAHYVSDGRAGSMTEHSRFARDGGRWYYVDALPD